MTKDEHAAALKSVRADEYEGRSTQYTVKHVFGNEDFSSLFIYSFINADECENGKNVS